MPVPATRIAALEAFKPVEDTDLDSDLFLGTFEADLMVGGVVSGNGTLYPGPDVIRANDGLNRAIDAGFIAPGQENHSNPLEGPTFKLPVVLQTTESTEPRPGVVEVSGKFAITNTQSGRDILTLHKIGIPVGVSLNGFVVKERIRLDRDSEFYAANKQHVGENVIVHRDLVFNELSPYDLVRVPSFGTFARPAQESQQVQEALARLAPIFKEPAEEQADNPQQEPDMDLQEKLDAAEATLAEVRESQAKIEEAQKAAEAKVTELTEANKSVAEALEASQNNANALKAKLDEAAEAEKSADATAVEALQTELGETKTALEALQVERATEKRAAALAKAVVEHSAGDHNDLVQEHLSDLVRSGDRPTPRRSKSTPSGFAASAPAPRSARLARRRSRRQTPVSTATVSSPPSRLRAWATPSSTR